MIVAGVMSGTSADGIDVALVRIAPRKPLIDSQRPSITLLAHEAFPYSLPLRRAVLQAMNAATTSTAELARLHWRLGLAYAEAVNATVKRHRVKLDLIGCHGQTLYHQPRKRALPGQEVCLHVASGRSDRNCGSNRRSCDFEFSARGYAGRRSGSAACSAARLCAVCRSRNAGACCRTSAASQT